ncbi:hypothetical protein [Georgenia sp. SUBG003]|uniref:hypothetical protein n=1 Tax=Georgenia sp. SUBG003 TaxID=1497974 RepID=UPI003AB8F592
MAVFAEVNRIALGAYDDLVDGGISEPVRPAEPFLAASPRTQIERFWPKSSVTPTPTGQTSTTR